MITSWIDFGPILARFWLPTWPPIGETNVCFFDLCWLLGPSWGQDGPQDPQDPPKTAPKSPRDPLRDRFWTDFGPMLALVWWILDKVLDHMWSIWVGTTFPISTILALYSQAVTLVMSIHLSICLQQDSVLSSSYPCDVDPSVHLPPARLATYTHVHPSTYIYIYMYMYAQLSILYTYIRSILAIISILSIKLILYPIYPIDPI